jgi:hypothetical protein
LWCGKKQRPPKENKQGDLFREGGSHQGLAFGRLKRLAEEQRGFAVAKGEAPGVLRAQAAGSGAAVSSWNLAGYPMVTGEGVFSFPLVPELEGGAKIRKVIGL